MKHLKNFDQINEQLFGGAVRKFAENLFGKVVKDGEKQPTGPFEPPKDLSGYGKFSQGKSESSPLVLVFGGIDDSKGRKSGEYMYDYFIPTGDKYNLFVAKDPNISGKGAYKAIKNKVGGKPSLDILYVFSGGYKPAMEILKEVGPKEFDKIYLVDIWMGNKTVEDFYTKLAKENPDRVEYYYTSSGAQSDSAKNSIVKNVSVKNAQKENNHFKTNEDAVASLVNFA